MAQSIVKCIVMAILLALIASSSAFTTAPAFTKKASYSIETSLPVKIKVNVGDGEPIESALRRFKREVSKSGHLMELRHKRYFENPQQRAIRKVKEGRLRKKFERMAKKRQRTQV